VVATLTRRLRGRSGCVRTWMRFPIAEQRVCAPHRPGHSACLGRDGHVAMLLGAARTSRRPGRQWHRAPHIPARGGDRRRCRHHDRGRPFRRFPVDAVFAMHVAPRVAEGVMLGSRGPAMASATIGSSPHRRRRLRGHERTRRPGRRGASIVMALQTVVSGRRSPAADGCDCRRLPVG
jgi:metal-dependent amidase/aminoacylase/carboxypeptidase family protein